MNIIPSSNLEGCIVIKPNVYNDNRGYFFESFNQKTFTALTGHSVSFVQDNESFSKKGTLRGLHFQTGEYAQAKLVRVVRGEVLDYAVDLRRSSPTYKKYQPVLLSESNRHQFFIPRGFAHGFVVLSDEAVFQYKCDNYYNKQSEAGINFADPTLNIDWKIDVNELIVSDKDKELPFFNESDFYF
ncbi:dTDP-4-dehydrorhamnose 3,5-epimerase [Mucilaginibacter calamicampi]|uniref:dTDP-4-dehydrorhamnose 3,5-epimerase n=1 Tax=Mucilaginibacter calamicampi TaxID=1302352 RepID=A0ABW2Z290_9SPHI